MQRTDYKENVDQKVEAAVEVAEQRVSSEKDNEFLEKEKQPNREYKGPAVFGGITFQYPKTWSAYQTDKNETMELVMNPLLISGNEKSIQSLRVDVESVDYEQSLRKYESNIKTGKIRASAYRLPKVQQVLGTRLDGEIAQGIQGSAVVLPLRDKSIVVYTESKDFVKDFDEIILPSFTFNP